MYLRATIFGIVFGAYAGSMRIEALTAMPDALGVLKLIAGVIGAVCLGIFTYSRDPEQAWRSGLPPLSR